MNWNNRHKHGLYSSIIFELLATPCIEYKMSLKINAWFQGLGRQKPDTVIASCDPSTQETEAGETAYV